jgi:hypothetical protein
LRVPCGAPWQLGAAYGGWRGSTATQTRRVGHVGSFFRRPCFKFRLIRCPSLDRRAHTRVVLFESQLLDARGPLEAPSACPPHGQRPFFPKLIMSGRRVCCTIRWLRWRFVLCRGGSTIVSRPFVLSRFLVCGYIKNNGFLVFVFPSCAVDRRRYPLCHFFFDSTTKSC